MQFFPSNASCYFYIKILIQLTYLPRFFAIFINDRRIVHRENLNFIKFY